MPASPLLLNVPPRSEPVGYAHLIARSRLEVVPPRSLVFRALQGGRREAEVDGRRTLVLPASYDPGPDAFDHLEFALKHEGVNLEILAAFFAQTPPEAVTAFVRRRPNGQYARRAWFLYEWLTQTRLPLEDLKNVPYVPLVDPRRFFTSKPKRSPRHAIDENLLGTREFSPMVERTPALVEFAAKRIDEQALQLLAQYDDETLQRAVHYLYTKETRSTWALEREKPNPQRAERFVIALREAPRVERLSEAQFARLQNIVVGEPYADSAYRTDQNYVGSGYVGRGVVEFVSPKPDDVPSLMAGLVTASERMLDSKVDAVVAAAVVGFGFVFVHPFRDGNGRLHRWLLHYILSKAGFTPPGLIFPISAVMLNRRAEYDAALERFSRPLNALIDYDLATDGSLTVKGETAPYYRYFDATHLAEALFRWTEATISTELKAELDFLVRYRAARAAMDEIVDMPEKEASLFVKLVVDNGGRLSKAKRDRFTELDDGTIARLEQAIREQMLTTLSSEATT